MLSSENIIKNYPILHLMPYFYLMLYVICVSCTILLISVVAAEKAHQNLLDGVEHFDKSQMKHATTEEKNPLPPIEGVFSLYIFCLP
jgi:hypothetical protein